MVSLKRKLSQPRRGLRRATLSVKKELGVSFKLKVE